MKGYCFYSTNIAIKINYFLTNYFECGFLKKEGEYLLVYSVGFYFVIRTPNKNIFW